MRIHPLLRILSSHIVSIGLCVPAITTSHAQVELYASPLPPTPSTMVWNVSVPIGELVRTDIERGIVSIVQTRAYRFHPSSYGGGCTTFHVRRHGPVDTDTDRRQHVEWHSGPDIHLSSILRSYHIRTPLPRYGSDGRPASTAVYMDDHRGQWFRYHGTHGYLSAERTIDHRCAM